MLLVRLCNTAREAVQCCPRNCAMLTRRIAKTPQQDSGISLTALHNLPRSISQTSQEHCTDFPAELHSHPGSIEESLQQDCKDSPAALLSLPGSITQSPRKHCIVSPAALHGRLYNAAGRLSNTARETLQCCWGDCAILLGRLCIPAWEAVQCSPRDCGMLPEKTAQTPQQDSTASLAALHSLSGSITQSPGQHCTVSQAALQSPWQYCTPSSAVLHSLLCSTAVLLEVLHRFPSSIA